MVVANRASQEDFLPTTGITEDFLSALGIQLQGQPQLQRSRRIRTPLSKPAAEPKAAPALGVRPADTSAAERLHDSRVASFGPRDGLRPCQGEGSSLAFCGCFCTRYLLIPQDRPRSPSLPSAVLRWQWRGKHEKPARVPLIARPGASKKDTRPM